MKKRTWLGMVSGLCLASVTARADAPLVVVAAPEALPTVDLQVDASDAGTPAVWEAMKSGKMTPEDAWKQGLLDLQVVQAGLSQGLAGGEDDGSRQLRLALGGALVQHAPEVVKDAPRQPKAVQLALADFYASRGDEKAVALYEAVLGQTKAPYEQGLVFKALGQFYADQKQPQKAQEAFERGNQVLTGKFPHFAGEMLILAARTWTKLGQFDKARLLDERVEKEGDAWMSGMALYDQASALIDQEQHEQARALLRTPVSGYGADQVRIGLTSLLASSYYRTGQWKEARQEVEAVAAQAQAVGHLRPGAGLEWQVTNAQQIQTSITKWSQTPLSVDQARVSLEFSQEQARAAQPLTVSLTVSLGQKTQIEAHCDSSLVKVEVSPETSNRGLSWEKVVTLTVSPDAARTGLKSSLVLRVPSQPLFKLVVPIVVSAVAAAPESPARKPGQPQGH